MPRLRRYRVFLVFAVFSVLAFIHFTKVREWASPNRNSHQSAGKQGKPIAPLAPPPQQRPPEAFDPHGPIQKTPTSSATVIATPPTTTQNQAHSAPTKSVVQLTDSLVPTHPAAGLPVAVSDTEFGPAGQGRLEVPGLNRTNVRWEKQPDNFPVDPSKLIPLPTGKPKDIPRIQFKFPAESEKSKAVREKRLSLIKTSFKRSWDGYKAHAWGRDELKPVYGGSRDPFMGWGATLVDGLDTLWMMGFKTEFAEAVKAVKEIDFKTSHRKDVPLFETVIRYLGGLIGAYDISEGKYPALLDKAVELAEILMGAFDTPNRMPLTYYWWAPAYASQPHRAATRVVLAELGSLSVEFTRLAQLTKQNKYYDAIARITDELERFQPNTTLPGLWPTYIDASGCKKVRRDMDGFEDVEGTGLLPPVQPKGDLPFNPLNKREDAPPRLLQDTQPATYDSLPKPAQSSDSPKPQDDPYCVEQGIGSPPFSGSDRYTLGALADSTYEYLPKMHLLIGGLSEQYPKMYKMAMHTVRKYLLFRPMLPDNRDVLFHAAVTSRKPPDSKEDLYYEHDGHHLGCFAGGMFALGAKIFRIEGDLDLARKLTEGCVWAYSATKTGIMPESFEMLPCPTLKPCKWNATRYYDRIDPFEEARKLRLETWRAQKAELEKAEAVEKKEHQVRETEALSKFPNSTATNGIVEFAKRHNAMPDDPSRISNLGNPVPDMLGPEPTFVPHKEFAEQRIKEERIPPGMTDIVSRKYILRPEAIESVFYMYRITGDESWREKGWIMFKAIEQNTRTELGTSAIKDVTSEVPMFMNEMESFWLGETLKYFFLLFSHPNVVSLDEYIL
ncbi:mannosyl-oligosaccharide 1,2-alpha-mannosidase [Emydomyces testavorans]|uniref:alpha-1,2-Mannosidase n=1 Tax=Emydomyces testavorans TaxID=2070801 RepID=A0AAF0IKK1_9EURO|nr:mannosyl-oligosaccharide 1,2-alpha-mannosidase [Emydomyces testavorans]